jgi:hypothetical protein
MASSTNRHSTKPNLAAFEKLCLKAARGGPASQLWVTPLPPTFI